jgi:hypothetical protein
MVELDPDSELLERARLRRERLALDPVRRDREADEAADLGALVVEGDVVAARGELAGARESRGAGADDGDPAAGRGDARAKGGVVRKRGVRRVALELRDRDRLPADVLEDARAPSHITSTGQTRAHVAPRRFWSKTSAAAPSGSPSAIAATNPGTSTPAGQATTQGAGA